MSTPVLIVLLGVSFTHICLESTPTGAERGGCCIQRPAHRRASMSFEMAPLIFGVPELLVTPRARLKHLRDSITHDFIVLPFGPRKGGVTRLFSHRPQPSTTWSRGPLPEG